MYIVVYVQQHMTNAYHDNGVLGIESTVVSKTDQSLCLPGAHFLVREIGNQHPGKNLESAMCRGGE